MTSYLGRNSYRFSPFLLGVLAIMVLGAGSAASAQALRSFKPVKVTIKMGLTGTIIPKESTLTDPKLIKDKTFIELDLRVIVDTDSYKNVLKIIDQGITPDSSGCAPGNYGPLDMEDGLRYFFPLAYKGGGIESIQTTVYPGERSRNPYNDVFCEYSDSPEYGGVKGAVFRVRGFFFVRYSQVGEGAIDIQLRPVLPTAREIGRYLKPKKNNGE